jgi:hypothetical protein
MVRDDDKAFNMYLAGYHYLTEQFDDMIDRINRNTLSPGSSSSDASSSSSSLSLDPITGTIIWPRDYIAARDETIAQLHLILVDLSYLIQRIEDEDNASSNNSSSNTSTSAKIPMTMQKRMAMLTMIIEKAAHYGMIFLHHPSIHSLHPFYVISTGGHHNRFPSSPCEYDRISA